MGEPQLTQILGLRGDLRKELGKVWKVAGQELSLEDDIFAAVLRAEGASQQLSFTGDSQGGPFLGRLLSNQRFGEHRTQLTRRSDKSHLESKLLEAIGKAGEGLIARTGLGNQGERGRRRSNLSIGNLDAGGLRGLVVNAGASRRSEASTAVCSERPRRGTAENRP